MTTPKEARYHAELRLTIDGEMWGLGFNAETKEEALKSLETLKRSFELCIEEHS